MYTIDPLGLRDVWFPVRTFFLVLAGMLLCVVSFRLISTPPWWLMPLPPVPPQARQLQTNYSFDHPSEDTLRDTRFEIDQPEAAVRAFYRTELTRRGWTYTHVWPGCGSQVPMSRAAVEAYDRGGRTLIVQVLPPDANRSQLVNVVEYQRRESYCNK
jgi:hypothetical protein